MSRRHGGPGRRRPPYEDALGLPKRKPKPDGEAPTPRDRPKAKDAGGPDASGAKPTSRADASKPRPKKKIADKQKAKGRGAATPKPKGRSAASETGTSKPKGRSGAAESGAARSKGRARDAGRPSPSARPAALEAAAREGIVATVDKRGRYLVAEPFFERAGAAGRMVLDRDSRIAVGDLVLVKPATRAGGHAQVIRALGRPDVASDVLEALMVDRGLRRRFDPAVERAAKRARDAGVGADVLPEIVRRDLTGLPTFTVDPVTARDFDDAISAERLDDRRTRIWVHIADVSAYVRPGSLVDREAARRATSVYVPGRVEPMLPEALSNDACSLVPLQQRAAVTVELEYDETDVTRAQFYRSTIRSDARLDYEQVDRVFAGEEAALEPWAGPLRAARAVAAKLHERRMRQDALELETSEPEFAFDIGGHVAESRPSAQTESHRLIEHLMIAANEQVAKLLSDRGVPSLYRVHEKPDGESALRLVDQLASLGVATPPVREHMTPSEAAEAIAACSRLVAQHARRTGHGRDALTFLVLRALKQAYYTPRNLGHAGLGLTHYAHFTSPIRRYPDLVAHRALLSTVGGGEDAPRSSDLEETGTRSSAREREAMQIERMADRIARAFLLERELFEGGWDAEFDGEVVGLIGAGAFVRFGGGHEGMLPVRRLRGDWWELNEQGTILTGERTGETIRLGDALRVKVERVETARGRVDLAPVE